MAYKFVDLIIFAMVANIIVVHFFAPDQWKKRHPKE